jgi:hypothetical protein
VNGQTGEVTGKAPWSWLKITMLVVLIIAVIVGLIVLASQRRARKSELDSPHNQGIASAARVDQSSIAMALNISIAESPFE